MIYLFEDKEDDLISILYRHAYGEEAQKNFIYCNGNSNIIIKLEDILKNTDDKVIVFLDMVPDNKELNKLYNKIRKLSILSDSRVYVLPIVCSEYYMIKSVCCSDLIINKLGLDECINIDWYKDSELITSEQDKNFCKTFEKYCKLVLMKSVSRCIAHTRGYTKENKLYGAYYSLECTDCGACKINESLLYKSWKLLREYDAIPCGSKFTNVVKLEDADIIEIHRRLVDNYNRNVRKFREIDTDKRKYKEIKYIH